MTPDANAIAKKISNEYVFQLFEKVDWQKYRKESDIFVKEELIKAISAALREYGETCVKETIRDLKLACPLCGETLDDENNVKMKWLEEAANICEADLNTGEIQGCDRVMAIMNDIRALAQKKEERKCGCKDLWCQRHDPNSKDGPDAI